MLNHKQQEEFEKMVNKGVEGIEALVYPQSDELHYAEVQKAHENDEPLLNYEELKEHQFNQMMKIINEDEEIKRTVKIKPERVSRRTKAQMHIIECAMDTQDYLGYLKCASALAKLNDNPVLGKFYQDRYDKFIKENTPK